MRPVNSERPEQELLSNPRSDRVKAVARLSGRSARLRAGRFVVEGPQAVRDAITHTSNAGGVVPGVVGELSATRPAAERYSQLLAEAAAAGIVARPVTEPVLA